MLNRIPGVSSLSAEVIVAEIGIDMSRFETAGHLVSWAGLCPSNDESAGKRRSNRRKKGAPWLKPTWCNAPGQRAHQGQLLPSPIPPPTQPPRPQKGDRSRSCSH
jgi:transposase